jgi:hypothetical protein
MSHTVGRTTIDFNDLIARLSDKNVRILFTKSFKFFTFIRPSRAAGPFSANFNINNGIENSRPPRILKPKLEFGYGR